MTSNAASEPLEPPGAAETTAARVIDTVYAGGVLRPLAPLDLPSGVRVRLQLLDIVPPDHPAPAIAVPVPASPSSWRARLGEALDRPLGAGLLAALTRRDVLLLLLGVLVYALTRAIGLTRFPIYFFSDEAIHPLQAEQLLRNGLRDSTGVFLPPYFQNDDRWNLSLSVYIHLVGVALFGKSVLVTRGISALVSVLAALALALTLKLVFQIRLWWAGPLVLAALPAWFLHSRTAFEVVLAVSFYACFLCAYLLYRYRSPRYLFVALIFGAATFYSYANGQGLMLASGVLLLISDLRFHLRQPRKVLLGAALLAALLASQYLRFRVLHPEALTYHLRTLDSYLIRPIPVSEKLALFAKTYLFGLSPVYWFFPNDTDLVRHQMKGMGHLSPLALPFVLVGLGVCLWRWRSAAHRAVLVALLAAPFSSALAAIAITRALAMVVPATLLICLGLNQLLAWVRQPRARQALGLASGALLCVLSFGMLRAALTSGPTWYSDYGLYGMQYGGQQLFDAIGEELESDPNTRVVMSPDWANNTNALVAFFLTPAQLPRVRTQGMNYYLAKQRSIDPAELFVFSPDDLQQAMESGKLAIDAPERVLNYPDGRPGFEFVRMRYVPDAAAVFAAEAAARQQLQEATIALDGQQVAVRYSQLDIGQLADLFDSRPETLIRGQEANPLVLEFTFPTPKTLKAVKLLVARMNLALKIVLTPADGGAPHVYTSEYRDANEDLQINYTFADGPQTVRQLRLELTDTTPPEDVHIHVREISFE